MTAPAFLSYCSVSACMIRVPHNHESLWTDLRLVELLEREADFVTRHPSLEGWSKEK